MKKNFLLILALIVVTSLVYVTCTKSSKENPEKNDLIQLKTGNRLLITVAKRNSSNAKLAPVCAGHGGQVGLGVSWDIATCRSECERGIGFRCGRETYAICQDGTHVPLQQNLGACNGGGVIIYQYSRRMDAEIEFYDNETAKIVFKNPMIDSESNNFTFEIESDQDIEMTEDYLIGGVSYDFVKFLTGNYEIDYSDGEYGSVIVNVDYVL